MKKLVIASNNPGKLREIGAILAPLDFEVFPQSAFSIPEAEEPYCTTATCRVNYRPDAGKDRPDRQHQAA